MMKAVVVDKDYGSVSQENLEYIIDCYSKNGIELVLRHFTTDDEIAEYCKDVDIILGTGNPPLTRKVFESCPNLKVVQRFGVGVNSVDLQAATDNNVLVLFMPGFCANELALHASGLILNILRNVSYGDRKIRNNEWPKATGPLPRDPRNLTLGLYGFGDSARPLYNIFRQGFGATVIANDKYLAPTVASEYGIELVDFNDLLSRSDIISIHAPLNEETKHIFNRETFQRMKEDSIIINIARGGLIHEEDLIEALKNGDIGFAGLDVFEQEPLQEDNPLKQMDNVVLTAHSAFCGDNAQQNQIEWSVELVDKAINQKRIENKYIANKDVESKIEGLERV